MTDALATPEPGFYIRTIFLDSSVGLLPPYGATHSPPPSSGLPILLLLLPLWIPHGRLNKMAGPIPIIDMRHAHSSLPRQLHFHSICRACPDAWFHAYPKPWISQMLIENILHRSRQFHEWELEDKWDFPNYTSPMIDPRLHTLSMDILALASEMRFIPGIFEIVGVIHDWNCEMMRVSRRVMEFLYDGLGIHSNILEDLVCLESRWMNADYFPHGPQNMGLTLAVTPYMEHSVLKIITQESHTILLRH